MIEMHIRIGTRRSQLALWQANYVKRKLEDMGHTVELVPITTTGDKITDAPLAKIGGKGLFVKEIEEALLRGDIDVAVHSLKDVPTKLPDGLTLGAITERELPYDVLISRDGQRLENLPTGAVVGTSSLRRKVQIKRMRRDLVIKDLRGNVDTRIRKLDEGQYDAIVLAYAGIRRMGWENRIVQILEDFIPAVGQGSMAVEIREDDEKIREVISLLDHRESRIRVEAERAFLEVMEGGCQVPMGAIAWLDGSRLFMKGFLSDLEGENFVEAYVEGNVEKAQLLGRELAEKILSQGGRSILESIL
nr:hydroxymethylbilane synthase [Thermocrinis albus]